MCSGRLRPLTRPSFADWVWITIAARFAATTIGRRARSRMCSGRLCPLTRPSFADWVWITIAARFAAITTHTSS